MKTTKILSPDELKMLADCEFTFTQHEQDTLKVGESLHKIRELRLFRAKYRDFETYCQKEIDYSRSTVDRYIGLWRVAAWIAPVGVRLTNQYQARPLLGMSQAEVVRAGEIALKLASGQRITHEVIAAAVLEIKEKPNLAKPPRTVAARMGAAGKEAVSALERAEAALAKDDKASLASALKALRVLLCETPPQKETGEVNDDAAALQTDPGDADATQKSNVDASTITERDPVQQSVESPDAAKSEAANATAPVSASFIAPVGPIAIRIGSSKLAASKWNDVPVFAANCVLAQNLPLPSLPYLQPHAALFTGKDPRPKKLSDGTYIEVGDDKKTLFRKARRILNDAGWKDIIIAIDLSDGTTITI